MFSIFKTSNSFLKLKKPWTYKFLKLRKEKFLFWIRQCWDKKILRRVRGKKSARMRPNLLGMLCQRSSIEFFAATWRVSRATLRLQKSGNLTRHQVLRWAIFEFFRAWLRYRYISNLKIIITEKQILKKQMFTNPQNFPI